MWVMFSLLSPTGCICLQNDINCGAKPHDFVISRVQQVGVLEVDSTRLRQITTPTFHLHYYKARF